MPNYANMSRIEKHCCRNIATIPDHTLKKHGIVVFCDLSSQGNLFFFPADVFLCQLEFLDMVSIITCNRFVASLPMPHGPWHSTNSWPLGGRDMLWRRSDMSQPRQFANHWMSAPREVVTNCPGAAVICTGRKMAWGTLSPLRIKQLP